MRLRSVQKQVLEERRDFKSRVIIEIFTKTASEKKCLIVQSDFCKISEPYREDCVFNRLMGNVV